MSDSTSSSRSTRASSSSTRRSFFRSFNMNGTLRGGYDSRGSTTCGRRSAIAAVLLVVALIAGCGGGSSSDWDGLASYVNENVATTGTIDGATLKARADAAGGWKCDDETSSEFYVAQGLDAGKKPGELFAFLYFLCGPAHAQNVLDGMSGQLSPADAVAATVAMAEFPGYAEGKQP